jgi:hypothetical protein
MKARVTVMLKTGVLDPAGRGDPPCARHSAGVPGRQRRAPGQGDRAGPGRHRCRRGRGRGQGDVREAARQHRDRKLPGRDRLTARPAAPGNRRHPSFFSAKISGGLADTFGSAMRPGPPGPTSVRHYLRSADPVLRPHRQMRHRHRLGPARARSGRRGPAAPAEAAPRPWRIPPRCRPGGRPKTADRPGARLPPRLGLPAVGVRRHRGIPVPFVAVQVPGADSTTCAPGATGAAAEGLRGSGSRAPSSAPADKAAAPRGRRRG